MLLRVRLYFIFGYITSQKVVKLPSTKVFCEMRERNLIGVHMKLDHKKKMISRRLGNWAVHILSYLANFIGVTPFILTNILEKVSIVST